MTGLFGKPRPPIDDRPFHAALFDHAMAYLSVHGARLERLLSTPTSTAGSFALAGKSYRVLVQEMPADGVAPSPLKALP